MCGIQRFGHPCSKLPSMWLVEQVEYEMIFHFQNTPYEYIGRVDYALGLCCTQLLLVEDHFIFYSLHINRTLELGCTNLITGVWNQDSLVVDFFSFNSQREENLCKTIIPKWPDKRTKSSCFPFHDWNLFPVLVCQWVPIHLTSNWSSL